MKIDPLRHLARQIEFSARPQSISSPAQGIEADAKLFLNELSKLRDSLQGRLVDDTKDDKESKPKKEKDDKDDKKPKKTDTKQQQPNSNQAAKTGNTPQNPQQTQPQAQNTKALPDNLVKQASEALVRLLAPMQVTVKDLSETFDKLKKGDLAGVQQSVSKLLQSRGQSKEQADKVAQQAVNEVQKIVGAQSNQNTQRKTQPKSSQNNTEKQQQNTQNKDERDKEKESEGKNSKSQSIGTLTSQVDKLAELGVLKKDDIKELKEELKDKDVGDFREELEEVLDDNDMKESEAKKVASQAVKDPERAAKIIADAVRSSRSQKSSKSSKENAQKPSNSQSKQSEKKPDNSSNKDAREAASKMTSTQVSSNIAVLDKAGAKGVEVTDFAQRFDANRNNTIEQNEALMMAQEIENLERLNGGREVHVGIVKSDDGKLRTKFTIGDEDGVPSKTERQKGKGFTFLPGKIVFSGHNHPSGNINASQEDTAGRIKGAINMVWVDGRGQTF